jgi:hypothetical protein
MLQALRGGDAACREPAAARPDPLAPAPPDVTVAACAARW